MTLAIAHNGLESEPPGCLCAADLPLALQPPLRYNLSKISNLFVLHN